MLYKLAFSRFVTRPCAGQAVVEHIFMAISVLLPSQSFPPRDGVGLSQARVLTYLVSPTPQVTGHVPSFFQLLQLDHPPSSKPCVKTRNISISIYIGIEILMESLLKLTRTRIYIAASFPCLLTFTTAYFPAISSLTA